VAAELGPDERRDLGSEQLDRAQHARVRERADTELGEAAIVLEELVLEEDLLGDLLGAADEQRSPRAAERVVVLTLERRPASRSRPIRFIIAA